MLTPSTGKAFPARCSRRSGAAGAATSQHSAPHECSSRNKTLRGPGTAGIGFTFDKRRICTGSANQAAPKLPAQLQRRWVHLGDFIFGKIQVFKLPFLGSVQSCVSSQGLMESRSWEQEFSLLPIPFQATPCPPSSPPSTSGFTWRERRGSTTLAKSSCSACTATGTSPSTRPSRESR